MRKQRTAFLLTEAERWFRRNEQRLGQTDHVSEIIETNNLQPKSILEIGGANGWRLRKLRERYKCLTENIDPLINSTAEQLPDGWEHYFDLVIFGFCLYVCDPTDYFKIVSESDRVLRDGGHVVIHDFRTATPYRRPYEHSPGLYSYHFNPAGMWTANPGYTLIDERQIGEDEAVVLLRRDYPNAFPDDTP